MDDLKLEPGVTQFPDFGNGVFEKVPQGAVFASTDDNKYIYDPFFSLTEEADVYCVRIPSGWRLLSVECA